MTNGQKNAGFDPVFESVEMMRRAWAGMQVPSALQPTMDVNEIDRRIADLRVIEQWLQLNQTMLHTTIQTLEIQRHTLAAFQSFSAPASAPQPGGAGPAGTAPPGALWGQSIEPANAAAQAAVWWDLLQQPLRQMMAGQVNPTDQSAPPPTAAGARPASAPAPNQNGAGRATGNAAPPPKHPDDPAKDSPRGRSSGD